MTFTSNARIYKVHLLYYEDEKRPFWSPINGSKQGLIHLHIQFLGIVHFALFRIIDFALEHVDYSNSAICCFVLNYFV